MTEKAEYLRLFELFHPLASQKISEVRSENLRFVHYTGADAAMQMIQNKEVWMRNASCMNDFREISYGVECLLAAYDTDTGNRFKGILDELFPGISEDLENSFNGWLPHFQNHTYVTCISEHLKDEDDFGRLSMWRAYGGSMSVAVVLNNQAFLSESDALKAYSSPVAYLTEARFNIHFEKFVNRIEKDKGLLESQGRNAILSWAFRMFRFVILCTKHPGFRLRTHKIGL